MTIATPVPHALLQSECASLKEQLATQKQVMAKIRENDKERTRLFNNFGAELAQVRSWADREGRMQREVLRGKESDLAKQLWESDEAVRKTVEEKRKQTEEHAAEMNLMTEKMTRLNHQVKKSELDRGREAAISEECRKEYKVMQEKLNKKIRDVEQETWGINIGIQTRQLKSHCASLEGQKRELQDQLSKERRNLEDHLKWFDERQAQRDSKLRERITQELEEKVRTARIHPDPSGFVTSNADAVGLQNTQTIAIATSEREAQLRELRELLNIERCRNAGLQQSCNEYQVERQHREQQYREKSAACDTQSKQIKELRAQLHSACEQSRQQCARAVLSNEASNKYQTKSKDEEIAGLKQKIGEMKDEACSQNDRSLKMRKLIQALEIQVEDLHNQVGAKTDWLGTPRNKKLQRLSEYPDLVDQWIAWGEAVDEYEADEEEKQDEEEEEESDMGF
ncbi:MAG: hypothetical protein Q9174_003952 [Haloplaca sp. 1 TL-2023]